MSQNKYLDYDGLQYFAGKLVDKMEESLVIPEVHSIPLVRVYQNDIELEPNKYYRLIGPQDELNITLGPIQDSNIVNHYILEFPYNGGSVTFPDYLEWAAGYPTLTVGHVYQLSVISRMAILMDFSN